MKLSVGEDKLVLTNLEGNSWSRFEVDWLFFTQYHSITDSVYSVSDDKLIKPMCSGSTTVGVGLANGKLLNLCLFGYFYFSLSLFMWYATSLSQGLKYPMKNSPVLTSRGILFTANGITQSHPIPHKLDMLI